VQLNHTQATGIGEMIRPGNGDAIWAIDFRSTVLEFPSNLRAWITR
jgi:hypothetical protein